MFQCSGSECANTGRAALYEATYRVPSIGRRVAFVCERHAVELEAMELIGKSQPVPALEDLRFIEV